MTIKTDLLSILVCPETKAPLLLTPDGNLVSTDTRSRRLYRIDDGIPVLLVSESEVLDEGRHADLVKKSQDLTANKEADKARKKAS